MTYTGDWSLERRRQETAEGELLHSQLFLKRIQRCHAELSTIKAPEILDKIDTWLEDIEIAFQRVADPLQLNQMEMARDFALVLPDFYDKRGKWDDWIRIAPLALEACKKLDDLYSMGEAYPAILNGIGLMHRMLGNSNQALFYYEQALELAISNLVKSDILTNLADINRGQPERALKDAEQAIEFAEQADDKNRQAKALEYKGLTYIGQERYNEGIECYEKALKLRKEIGNLPRIAMTLSFLAYGLTHREDLGDLSQALAYYEQAHEIEQQLKNPQGIARYHGDIAVLFNKLGEYEKAIEHSNTALLDNIRIGFFRGVALNHIRLADSHLKLALSNKVAEHIDLAKVVEHIDLAIKYREHLIPFDLRLSKFSQLLSSSSQNLFNQRNIEKAGEYTDLATELENKSK
jgi:tetratricopeptide (TPR) repeat protein